MSEQERDQSVRLSDVFRRVVRRWKLILAFALCFAFAGGAYYFVQEETFTSSATLTVSPITTNPFNAGAVNQQINITTEREILGSREVARIASEKLNRDVTPADLLAGSEVAAPSGSQILEVTVTAASPTDAADFANALAEAYLEFRAEGASEVALGFIEELDRRISSLEQIEALDPGDRSELASLRDQRASLSLVAENPGRIIGEAAIPGSPSSPGLPTWTVIGAALGLLVGLGIAFLRDRFDPLLRDPSRMRERLGTRVTEFREATDEEAARATLRAVIERRRSDGRGSTPFTIMLVGPDQQSMDVLTTTLINVAHQSALSASTARIDSVLLTYTTPTDEALGRPLDLLFLDASTVTESSALAVVARDSGCIVIVVHRRTHMAALEHFLRDVVPAAGSPVGVFLHGGSVSNKGTSPERPTVRARRTDAKTSGVS